MTQADDNSPYLFCPQCGNRMRRSALLAGEKMQCPQCGAPVDTTEDVEVELDEDDEVEEYALQHDPTPRPRPNMIEPPAHPIAPGDESARDMDENYPPRHARSESVQRPRRPVRDAVPEDDGETLEEDEAPREKGDLVWEPGRGISYSRLFFAGTFNFVLRPRVQFSLLLLTIFGVPTGFCLMMARTPGLAVLGGVAFLTGGAWFILAASYGLAVLRDTSCGADNVQWPDLLTLVDTLSESLYVLTSLFFAALPGAVLALLGHAAGEERLFLTAGSVFLLFPVFLLSTLESNSPTQPYSAVVWRSVLREKLLWGQFYLLTFCLWGAAHAAVMVLGSAAEGGAAAIVWPIAYNVAGMIYVRLLGRLAWFCSNRHQEELEREESDDRVE